MKIKKANTFGKLYEWQINANLLRLIVEKTSSHSKEYITMEMVDDILITLAEMGYIELEE